jgi:hypothetical protein
LQSPNPEDEQYETWSERVTPSYGSKYKEDRHLDHVAQERRTYSLESVCTVTIQGALTADPHNSGKSRRKPMPLPITGRPRWKYGGGRKIEHTMLPATRKPRLANWLAYPVGYEVLSTALAGVPMFEHLRLQFLPEPYNERVPFRSGDRFAGAALYSLGGVRTADKVVRRSLVGDSVRGESRDQGESQSRVAGGFT